MTENIDSYFENGRGFRSNPFRKGYLTDEERKEPFRWFGENFVFFAKHADLSETGVEIYRNENYSYPCHCTSTWETVLLRDCMIFGIWWRSNVHKFLNGFNGFDTVKIEIDPKLNMKLEISF
jgi:hypothetical protein